MWKYLNMVDVHYIADGRFKRGDEAAPYSRDAFCAEYLDAVRKDFLDLRNGFQGDFGLATSRASAFLEGLWSSAADEECRIQRAEAKKNGAPAKRKLFGYSEKDIEDLRGRQAIAPLHTARAEAAQRVKKIENLGNIDVYQRALVLVERRNIKQQFDHLLPAADSPTV